MNISTISIGIRRFATSAFNPPPRNRKRPPIDHKAYAKLSNYESVSWLLIAFMGLLQVSMIVGVPFLLAVSVVFNGASQDVSAQEIGILIVFDLLLGAAGVIGMFTTLLALIGVLIMDRRRGVIVPRLSPQQILTRYGYPCSDVILIPVDQGSDSDDHQ